MTDPIERETPSAQDDIRFVLQQTLFQQVQALRKFTTTDTLQLQIPDTDVFVFAGQRASVVDFIKRELAYPAASFDSYEQDSDIPKWWQRIGCTSNPGTFTGEESARDAEIDELRAELARRCRAQGGDTSKENDSESAAEQPMTGDLREAFNAVCLSWNGHATKDELSMAWGTGSLSGEMFRAGAQAARQSQAGVQAVPVELQQQISDLAASRDGYKSQLEHLTSQPITLTLTGNQLSEALGLINPDGPENEDQCNDELTFGVRQHRDDDGKVETGMCCWNDDMDGEVFPLPDEYAAPAAHAIAARVVPDNLTLSFSREDWGVVFDGVMLDIERSEKRKAVNSESNSDARAEQGRAILAAIRSASSIAAPAAQEAEQGSVQAGIQSSADDPMRTHFTCEAKTKNAYGVTSTLYFTKFGSLGTFQLYRNEAEALYLNIGAALGLSSTGSASVEDARDAARYTCIGKGGEYELIGTAKGAGTVAKLDDMRVYRATNGRLYFRTCDDFDARMQRITGALRTTTTDTGSAA